MLYRQMTSGLLAGGLLAGGCLLGGVGYAWPSQDAASIETQQLPARQSPRVSLPRHRAVVPIAPLHLKLKLSPMGELTVDRKNHSQKHAVSIASRSTDKAKKTARRTQSEVAPQAPLDLALPALDNLALPEVAQSGADENNDDQPPAAGQSLLSQHAVTSTPNFTSEPEAELFNRNNGLRGFMKQSWVNQRVGFQGGLAIKQERLRQDNSDLQDNMAVGMGLLLAF